MLPITLIISCLNYIGVVGWFSELIAPAFNIIGLPGESALVFIASALSSIYAAIALIATLGIDFRSVTILAVMCLICHNLIIETAIQAKTGAKPLFIVILRITAAFTAAAMLNLILPKDMTGRVLVGVPTEGIDSWGEVFTSWFFTIAPLTIKMSVIIILLNILQGIFREFRIINLIAVALKPFMTIFGLNSSTSFLWIICNIIGIAYGGAAMIQEMERGEVTLQDSRLLNTHVSISHSLLEDTSIFFAIGVGLGWLILPRIILAIGAVWIYRGWIAIFKSEKITPSCNTL